jgi:hypothetical protein
MFSAKPVIASVDEDSDTALCMMDSGAGWCVAPEDVNALSMAIQQAYHSSGKVLKNKGKVGLEYALRTFSKESNLTILAKAIYNVLAS